LVFEAVMETAARRPVRDRISLYRAAADFAGSSENAASFLALASNLEAVEKSHAELALQFAAATAATHNGTHGGNEI
jgi:hypothetical protein